MAKRDQPVKTIQQIDVCPTLTPAKDLSKPQVETRRALIRKQFTAPSQGLALSSQPCIMHTPPYLHTVSLPQVQFRRRQVAVAAAAGPCLFFLLHSPRQRTWAQQAYTPPNRKPCKHGQLNTKLWGHTSRFSYYSPQGSD